MKVTSKLSPRIETCVGRLASFGEARITRPFETDESSVVLLSDDEEITV